jgi:cellulose biosynthesis protein BcsQ
MFSEVSSDKLKSEDHNLPMRHLKGLDLCLALQVTRGRISQAEASGSIPPLPRDAKSGKVLGLPLDQLTKYQQALGVRPGRLAAQPAATIAFGTTGLNSGATTAALFTGAAFACRGMKVLLIDLDPSGALTTRLGFYKDYLTDPRNLLPHIKGQHTDHSILSMVRPTPCPRLSFIPSSYSLRITYSSPLPRPPLLTQSLKPSFEHFTRALRTTKDKHDIVIIDAGPLDNLSAIAGSAIADALVLPVNNAHYGADAIAAALTTFPLIRQLPKTFSFTTNNPGSGVSTIGQDRGTPPLHPDPKISDLPVSIPCRPELHAYLARVNRTPFDINTWDVSVPRREVIEMREDYQTLTDELFKNVVRAKWLGTNHPY